MAVKNGIVTLTGTHTFGTFNPLFPKDNYSFVGIIKTWFAGRAADSIKHLADAVGKLVESVTPSDTAADAPLGRREYLQ